MISASSQLASVILGKRFESLHQFGDEDRRLLAILAPKVRRRHDPQARLAAEGVQVSSPFLILSGWACRARILADGRRQIIGVLLPGDVVGLNAMASTAETSTAIALTSVRTVEIPDLASLRASSERCSLAESLLAARAEEDYFLACHIVRLGRQTAYERMGHLLLELECRLAARGLSFDGRIPFPLTQETLADVLGLSVVHVNRTLQQMRKDGLIDFVRGWLTIRNREAASVVSEFKPPPAFAHARQALRPNVS